MSKRNLARIAAALFLAVVVLASAGSPALAGDDPTLIAVIPGLANDSPRTDGETVVWVEGADLTRNGDVIAAKLSDRSVFSVAAGPVNQSHPDIDGGFVVWVEAREASPFSEVGDIRGKNVKTGAELAISEDPYPRYADSEPAISGNLVVWFRTDFSTGRTSLMARDIASMAEPFTVAQLEYPVFNWGPARIDGGRVVWAEKANRQDETWRLLTTVVGSGSVAVIATDSTGSYDVSGDTVIYESFAKLNVLNVQTGATGSISIRPGVLSGGRYIFNAGNGLPGSAGPYGLWGYDLAINRSFLVKAIDAELYPYAADAKEGVFAWGQGSGQQGDVHAVPVADAMTSSPRPASATTSPDRQYFPETGHYLSYGFKYFWDHSGGLPVFGYPLTEEFQELSKDTGDSYTVQYLERQRFEYHPEFKGTPYETELGRLGAEDAAGRGITDTLPFQRVTPTSPSAGDATFFPETGHWLSGGFLSYWQGHGLDFGDAGVSFRESLALFGYPVSEEYVDPSTGLITQYFERAVFEYHPENPGAYKVLLRRLGVGVITDRGW